MPAVRWSSYQFARGGGLPLLDRGLTSHELNGRTVTLALVNAQATYRNHSNELLRGSGSHRFEYALVPYGGTWQEARVPHHKATITNMMGEKPSSLAGGPGYGFTIRPQQIVTLRFGTNSRVPEPSPIRTWKTIVPPERQKTLERRIQAKGHSPRRY